MLKDKYGKNLENAKRIGLDEKGKFVDNVFDKFLWMPKADLIEKDQKCALKSCGGTLSSTERFVCLEDSQTEGDLVALFHVECFKKLIEK